MTVNLFDANFYRSANSDLRNYSDAQAWSHFQNFGLNEGRSFSPFANLNFYRSSNSDLSGYNNRQLFDHLQNYGVQEGRRFSALVDLNFYHGNSTDLAGYNKEQVFEHLRNYGIYEGRRFSLFVDLNLYRAANPDLSVRGLDNKQLLDHLANFGVAEGRRFSVSFNSNFYRTAYSDLAAAGMNNSQLLEHFQRYGLNEGRTSSESFNVSHYLASNADLRAFGYNPQQAHQHFEMFGFREGRLGAASHRNFYPSTDPAVGNTLYAANNFGILTGSLSTSGSVGIVDRNDYYRFTLASTSNFKLSLGKLNDTTQVKLIWDKNGNGLTEDDEDLDYAYGSSYYPASISSPLGAGTYIIQVSLPSSSNKEAKYTLEVSATAAPTTTPIDPGNSLSTALDIGTLNGSRSFNDFVGSADRDDYYRFTLDSQRYFNLSLSGLNGYTEVELIQDRNRNGQSEYSEILASDYVYTANTEAINSTLPAGTYFIRVNAPDYSDTNTMYSLTVSA